MAAILTHALRPTEGISQSHTPGVSVLRIPFALNGMRKAYTGLRWGEMAGLHVEHVDTVKRRVSVVQNAVTVGSFVEVGTPKTHEARTVPYPDFLDTELATQAAGKPCTGILFGDGITCLPLPRTGSGWFSRAVDRWHRRRHETR